MFVRQGEGHWGVGGDVTNHQSKFGFAIRTDSLLQHGCTVFQEGLNTCPQNEVSIRQVAEYGEDKGRQRTVLLDSGGNFACLKFASRRYGGLLAPAEEADSFVIILETHKCANPFWDTATINLLVTEENQFLERDTKQLMDSDPDWTRRQDRISKTMKSGRSVSVALRRRNESKETLNVLDITIDPHGKLPWPDLG